MEKLFLLIIYCTMYSMLPPLKFLFTKVTAALSTTNVDNASRNQCVSSKTNLTRVTRGKKIGTETVP